jgi:adenylyl cyclase-associated protein
VQSLVGEPTRFEASDVKLNRLPYDLPAAAPAAARGAAKKGPPVFELQGDKKWIIENQDNNKDLVITECSISQALYIYKCDNCVIKVDQKINAITLDSCKKVCSIDKAESGISCRKAPQYVAHDPLTMLFVCVADCTCL